MSLLAQTCPHCNVEHVQFYSCAAISRPNRAWTVFYTCNACKSGIVAEVQSIASNHPNPHEFSGDLRQVTGAYNISRIYPKSNVSSAPEHTPANVSSFYIQAQDALKRKHFDASGAMCRKALDVATKTMDSTLKGDLNKRIDALAAAHKITPAMKDWAHAVRLDGNDAVHDDQPFGEDDARQLASFTEIFLLYAFTLPGMLEVRKNKIEPAAASPT